MRKFPRVAILLAWAALPVAAADEPDVRAEIPSVLITAIDQIDVPAREIGVLSVVSLREGGTVSAGDVLATIDDTEAALARDRAAIDVELARDTAENDVHIRYAAKQRDVAEAELKRAHESVQKYRNSISATELDQLRLAAERAALEVEQAQHERRAAELTLKSKLNELALAERNVQRRKIVSPVKGVVVEVHRKAGEWVQPGEAVFRVMRTDRLQAEGFLPSELADPGLVGCVAQFTVAGTGAPQTFRGRVFFVSPEIHPVRDQVRVAAEFDNATGKLRPGLKGSLLILSQKSVTVRPGAASRSETSTRK